VSLGRGGAEFADGEAVEADFDQVLSFRAGMRTSGVTSNSRPRNSCLPVRCCVGSPAARRRSKEK